MGRKRSRSSSSSESASSSDDSRKRRKEKKRAKHEEREQRREQKELEKLGRREGEYLEKVAKGVHKILEKNNDPGKGRPPSLVKAALCAALAATLEIKKAPQDVGARIIPAGSSRLLYLRCINYGLELLVRLGFTELDDGDGAGVKYGFKEKYLPFLDCAINVLQRALIEATTRGEAAERRLVKDRMGYEGLQKLLGGGDDVVNKRTSKAIGVALAAAAGDVLGLPVANWDGKSIAKWFGTIAEYQTLPPAQRNNDMVPEAYWTARVSKPKEFLGRYSGEYFIAVEAGLSILEQKRVDARAMPKRIVGSYATYKSHGKLRMFSEPLRVIIRKLAQGDDPRSTGMSLNPSGLKGADAPALCLFLPLALFDEADGGVRTVHRAKAGAAAPKKDADAEVLDCVKALLLPFIVHSDGIGVAFVYVHAVLYLLSVHAPEDFSPADFIAFVREKARLVNMSDDLRRALKTLEKLYDGKHQRVDDAFLQCLEELEEQPADEEGQAEAAETIYTSAVGAFCGALFSFLNASSFPARAVTSAVALGEAASVMGLLAGSLAGALHGGEWVPRSWYDLLENGDGLASAGVGKDRFLQLAIDCVAARLEPVRHLEDPVAYRAKKYRVSAPADEAAAEQAASSIPEAPPGTNALVAAMPVSMRKYALGYNR
ncbi:ADP-ribosyl-[dinitrogen reductase] glycohydrolase [Diplonema papillatum]|nr:ADP-ribosyl-[dinitrogen reductase] glycohydrolase [Diplonema papillatum]KAJ9443422.1 ADP-ribosyl-[dinitrogen reductase] glycohydrolase [Diplonema papillatum]